MKNPVFWFLSLAMVASLSTAELARADADGKLVTTPYDCGVSVFSSMKFICDAVAFLGGDNYCTTTANTCVKASQEIFNGLNIELASPTNIKNWTGFGGMGELYQAAAVCMLRDIKDAPLVTTATASSPLGNITMKQEVGFLSFDKDKRSMEGYQRSQACAPVIGCVDILTQKFSFKSTNSSLKGSGMKAGEYEMYNSFGLDVTMDGLAQGVKATIPAISVSTPYGNISAKPEFGFGRAVGAVFAPYNGNIKSAITGPYGTAKMWDLYGRNPGAKACQVYPTIITTGHQTIDNSKIGWISQVGLGSRDANPKTTAWAPPAAEEFPKRPDLDMGVARSNEEKFPNAYLGASVKVAYSPTDLIPEWIRNSGLISLSFSVFAEPKLDTGFTSQLNFWNSEISKWSGKAYDWRPGQLDQFKGLAIQTAASAASRFALEAGVDLTIHLHVPLPFPLDDIDEDLVNIHPRTTVLEKVDAKTVTGSKTPMAVSQATEVLKTKKFFQIYNTLNGPKEGAAHIQACLANPTAPGSMPAEPTYTPGNPEDLTQSILYPCNICVGSREKTWKDENGVEHTMKGFLQTLFPSNVNPRPDGVKWTCDQLYEVGCYDMCSYDVAMNQLTVVETAREMLVAGKTKNMPGRCR